MKQKYIIFDSKDHIIFDKLHESFYNEVILTGGIKSNSSSKSTSEAKFPVRDDKFIDFLIENKFEFKIIK